MQFINNISLDKCINNREHRASTRQATEQLSRQAKPKQRPSGQSTCSCCTLIGQRLSLFVQRQQREGERERESNESKRARACRTKHVALSLYSPKRVTMHELQTGLRHPVLRRWLFLFCEANRLRGDTTRFSCCSAFFVCRRGVYATTQRRSNGSTRALRKFSSEIVCIPVPPTATHTPTQNPSQAVKILIPLPFQDSIKTATSSKR